MEHDPKSMPNRSRDQIVATRLADQAARVDLGTPMVEVVIQRGRQRQQRRRTALGVMSVAGVCAAAIVSVNVLSRPPEHQAVMSPGEPVAASGYTPAQLVESNLVWSQFEPDSAAAVSFLNGTAELTGDGPFIAWSTAPGLTGGKATMWRSDDGLSWQQLDGVPVFSSADVVEHDGKFLAFGTTPSPSSTAGSVQSIATSADGGATWTTETLPIDTSDLEDEPGVASVTLHATSIAAGPAGVLAVVRESVNLDWNKLVPPESTPYGYNTTPLGVEILGPNQCGDPNVDPTAVGTTPGTVPSETAVADTAPANDVSTVTTVMLNSAGAVVTPSCAAGTIPASTVPAGANTTTPLTAGKTLTWAALGVSEKAAAASMSNDIRLFFSADGVSFAEVSSPVAADAGYADLKVTDTDDGFAAAVLTYDQVTGTSSNEVFHTTDGQTWTDLGPAPVANPDSFSAMGDRLVMSGWTMDRDNPSTGSTTVVAVRDPDGSWTATLLNDLVLPSDGVITSLSGGGLAVGADGITMVGWLYVDPIAELGGIEVTHDGVTMYADDSNFTRRFADESGAELGTVTNGASSSPLVSIDPMTGQYQVRLTEDGDVVATFSDDDVNAQIPLDAGNGTPVVLHSADGVAWSREALDDLVGQPVSGTGGIRVTDTSVIVAANLADQTNADGTHQQVLLLGTPKT